MAVMDGTHGKCDGRLRDSQTMHITCVIDAIALHTDNVIGCVDAVDHFHRPAKRLPPACKERQGSQGVDPSQVRRAVGVSYATVNRWENRQSRPNNLAWARILELESSVDGAAPDLSPSEDIPPVSGLDFSANPDAVSASCRGSPACVRAPVQPGICDRDIADRPAPPPAHRRLSAHA